MGVDARGPDVYKNGAFVYLSMSQPTKSIELLNKALALYPKGNDSIFGNMAGSYLMLGDNVAAAAWAQKWIDKDKGIPQAYAVLAMAYAEQGEERRARAPGGEARRRFP